MVKKVLAAAVAVIVLLAIAAAVWALYGSMLGFFGGRAFEDSPLTGLLLAFGIALAVTATIEAVQWFLRRRR